MGLLQTIEDKQFAANVKMLRELIEKQLVEQKRTNDLLERLLIEKEKDKETL